MRTPVFPGIRWVLVVALAALFGLGAAPSFAGSDVIFAGGGLIKDGSKNDAKRITFSVNLFVDSGGAGAGHLQFQFHNLDDIYGLDHSRFSATAIDAVLIETRYLDATPYTFVRIEAHGKLNGMEGWSVLARFGDFGVPARNKALPAGEADALRLVLFDPDGVAVYDTALDFPREQSWRTLLDGGNVTVDMRMVPGS